MNAVAKCCETFGSQNGAPQRSFEFEIPGQRRRRTGDSNPTSSVTAGLRDSGVCAALRNSRLLPAAECSDADDIICTSRAEDADLAPFSGPKELLSLSNRFGSVVHKA